MNTILKSTKNILIPFIALISFGLQAENKVDNIEIKRAIYPDKGQQDDSDDIIMIDENGKKVALSELKGKVVFVNLWATWCRPCVEEMPTINNLKNKFGKNENIVFILLNVEADLKKSKKFMKDKNYDLPVYIATNTISSKYFQGAIPTTLIFNKEGDLEAQIQGSRDFDQPEIYKALKSLTEK